jgi:hypothetical protein
MFHHARSSHLLRVALVSLCLAGSASLALAQQPPQPDGGPKRGEGMKGEGMRGEGMRGNGMPMMMCADGNEMSMHFLRRFENTIQPKPEQKADLEALKAAVAKGDQIFKSACPTEAERADRTPTGHLARMEKTAQATVDVMKLVRPPFEALYAKLDDKQRDRLRWAQHGRHPQEGMMQMHYGMHPMMGGQ